MYVPRKYKLEFNRRDIGAFISFINHLTLFISTKRLKIKLLCEIKFLFIAILTT